MLPQNHCLAIKCTCKIHYRLVSKQTVTISKLVLLVYNLTFTLYISGSANYFILVWPLDTLKCEQARGVWGHAPPGKVFKLVTLRSLLRPCLGQCPLNNFDDHESECVPVQSHLHTSLVCIGKRRLPCSIN